MTMDKIRKPNKTAIQLYELLKLEGEPLHLKEMAVRIKKTRQACYTAIHKEPLLFKQTGPATYTIIGGMTYES